MHKFITLAACLLLGACASNQQSLHEPLVRSDSSPLASNTLEAIHNTQAIPQPVNAGLLTPNWPISAHEPRSSFGSSMSNYRMFSLRLKKGEHYTLNVSSTCHSPCTDFNKLAIKPQALLLDANGAVLAKKPSRVSTVLGQMTLSWDGQAAENGTYYLLVAADNDDAGRTIVIDDAWINNSPLMLVEVDTNSSPLGDIRAYSSLRQN